MSEGGKRKIDYEMGALMAEDISFFVMVRGVKKDETFQVSFELSAFAENYPAEKARVVVSYSQQELLYNYIAI